MSVIDQDPFNYAGPKGTRTNENLRRILWERLEWLHEKYPEHDMRGTECAQVLHSLAMLELAMAMNRG